MEGWRGLPLVIYGSGGISREVALCIQDINRHNKQDVFRLVGFVERDSGDIGGSVDGLPIVASDETFAEFAGAQRLLGVVIPIGTPSLKERIAERLAQMGLDNLVFPNVIHPDATFDARSNRLGVGNVITSGVRFTTNTEVGDHNLFNLGVTVGHDCTIGSYCVVNPLAALSGGVVLHDGTLIGTGAKLLQYNTIGKDSIVGAGAVVTKDVQPGVTVVGVPARLLEKQ